MAGVIKRVAEQSLVRSGLSSLLALRTRPASAILAYHNIVPHGESSAGDLSLHTDQATFAAQLDWIRDRHRIVPLAEILSEKDREDEATRIAITFDDAYVGTLTAGVEELRSRNIPATVFVPPGLLDREGFWWDLLSGPAGTLDPKLREYVLGELGGRQDKILAFARDQGLTLKSLPEHARPATSSELSLSGRTDLISFGNHTWSHPNLAAVLPAVANEEVLRTRRWLEESGLRLVDCLAYPYGIASLAAHQGGGYDTALLVQGGLCELRNVFRGTPDRIPRINVPRGLSLEGLALRLCGIL